MSSAFKIITWNVNSLRVRLPQVLEYITEHQPDILALQETKLEDLCFPIQPLKEAGYYCAFSGQKAYNGVAVLSRTPCSNISPDLPNFLDPQRRVLSVCTAQLKLINIYAPNGAVLHSEHYYYKLRWFDQLHAYCYHSLQSPTPLALVGDFNIAPEDRDVYDPETVRDQVLVSALERKAFQKLLSLGLHDSFRLFNQDPGAYTWWDYRAAAFRRNHGLRLDHILVNNALLPQCVACEIDTTPRRAVRPSDHAPVILTINLA